MESSHADAKPVMALVPPGPVVTIQQLIFSEILEAASAAKEAACS